MQFFQQLGQANPEKTPVYDVYYAVEKGLVGEFYIGAMNNTLILVPSLNLDYTLISAKNCTTCPRRNYDVAKSE